MPACKRKEHSSNVGVIGCGWIRNHQPAAASGSDMERADVKVFISSLISGFEAERDAARRAVSTLRQESVMAEDFGARPASPQVACLQGLRSSDVVVLILGSGYGFVPVGSTLSATHQEYREARETKPVLAFVQQGVTAEPDQQRFIEEVQAWEGGLFRGGFTDAADLRDGITRALYDVSLANAVGPVNEGELVTQATALIPAERRNQVSGNFLDVAIVGGPTQRLLRPVEMESDELGEHLQQLALFGADRVFDRSKGSRVALDGPDLVVSQERGASIRLTEKGSMVFRLSLEDQEVDARRGFGGMIIVEEVVRQTLTAALGYAAAAIERIDPTQRITHLLVAISVASGDFRTWRTRAQNAASQTSMQMSMTGSGERKPVTIGIRRAALPLDRSRLVDDLLVPLRRQFSTG